MWDNLSAPQILRVLKLYYKVASSQLPAPQIAPRTKGVLQSRQIAPRTKVVLPSHQFSSSSSPDTKVVLQSRQCSPAFRALDTHDLRKRLRGHRTNRTLACISRTRHARSPQRVVRAPDKSHSRLHFAHSTRTISAEGCARMGQIACTLACISRTRHARSPQRVARALDKSHSRLHFAHSTRTISSSPQNERFVRDVLKNSHVRSLQNERANPNGSDIHLYHNSQPHDLTIPCACYESFPRPHV